MPWTSVKIILDKDKTGTSEAASVEATWEYDAEPHIGKTFVYPERLDTGNRSGFVARANAAKNANTLKLNREDNLSQTLLAALQAS